MNQVYVATFDPVDPLGNIYMDLCIHFLTISSRLHRYIVVLYYYYINTI